MGWLWWPWSWSWSWPGGTRPGWTPCHYKPIDMWRMQKMDDRCAGLRPMQWHMHGHYQVMVMPLMQGVCRWRIWSRGTVCEPVRHVSLLHARAKPAPRREILGQYARSCGSTVQCRSCSKHECKYRPEHECRSCSKHECKYRSNPKHEHWATETKKETKRRARVVNRKGGSFVENRRTCIIALALLLFNWGYDFAETQKYAQMGTTQGCRDAPVGPQAGPECGKRPYLTGKGLFVALLSWILAQGQ